jgi:hypothetical protein
VTVRLSGGDVLAARARGARGYPDRPASRDELDAKFRACARRAVTNGPIEDTLIDLHRFEELADVRRFTARLATPFDGAELT